MPSNRVSEPPPEKKVDLEQALAQMLTSHSVSNSALGLLYGHGILTIYEN